MNRVLSLPLNTVTPAQLQALTRGRHDTQVTGFQSVVLNHGLGQVEMRFAPAENPLEAGARVYVWWKGGGFVCAPADQVDAQAAESARVARRVSDARFALAEARKERASRFGGLNSAPMPLDVDLGMSDTVSIY
ncbi:MAG: hypothetical protein ACKOF9_02520 [Burkholderiales bacterium]